jgi:hypothetical protein
MGKWPHTHTQTHTHTHTHTKHCLFPVTLLVSRGHLFYHSWKNTFMSSFLVMPTWRTLKILSEMTLYLIKIKVIPLITLFFLVKTTTLETVTRQLLTLYRELLLSQSICHPRFPKYWCFQGLLYLFHEDWHQKNKMSVLSNVLMQKLLPL